MSKRNAPTAKPKPAVAPPAPSRAQVVHAALAPSTPGQRLRAAREQLGLSCAEAAARMSPPIGKQSWLDAERGKGRSLDWWYGAALALGIDPHDLDPRLASIR